MSAKYLSGNLKGKDRLKDVGIDERTQQIDIKEMWCENMEWSQMVQDRAELRAHMNTAVTFCVSVKA